MEADPSANADFSAGGPAIDRIEAAAYRVPTDAPEADGTFCWDSTTIVVVHVHAADQWGLGYTYGHPGVASVITDTFTELLKGRDSMDPVAGWDRMTRSLRNAGQPGIGSTAVSAMDCALWDLKARLLGLPLITLLGSVRPSVPVYGSGGFTSYDERRLRDQLGGWVAQGIERVKMKVGWDPANDPSRVAQAREAIGPSAELYVDANGAYSRKQALAMAEAFAERGGVQWFEEPRPSDDLAGLRLLRDRAPAGMDIAAGEYGYGLTDFRALLEAGAIDCLQADVTRCGGITDFMKAAALCEAHGVPLSAHTAPAEHAHVGCAVQPIRHVEYFHDHARLESMLFDGAPKPEGGTLRPDRARPGMGLTFKRTDAERYRV